MAKSECVWITGNSMQQQITDPFPLPFCDTLLDAVAGHEIYSFLDGFSGYNQVLMAPKDRDKTAFVTEWGCLPVM